MEPKKVEIAGLDNLYIDACLMGNEPRVEGKVQWQFIPRREKIEGIDKFSIVFTYRYKDGKFTRISPDWMLDSVEHETHGKLTPEIIEEWNLKFLAKAEPARF